MKPNQPATTNDTTNELQLQTLAHRENCSARWISAALNTERAGTGVSSPPGAGSHGTNHHASTTSARVPTTATTSPVRRLASFTGQALATAAATR